MYDARTRDRFRIAVAGLTGVLTVASATTVGALSGLVARAAASQTQPQTPQSGQDVTPQAAAPRVRWKQRPQRTIVTTRVVHRRSASAPVGGGTVLAPAPASPAAPAGGGAAKPPPAPAPPPPPPPAPPAPSSGS